MNKLIQIHPDDNILIIRQKIEPGDHELINGEDVTFNTEIGLGHKVAARLIKAGQQIIKYGVHIGSAITDIPVGGHIHLHNMKSDYLPTYTLDKEFIHVS